MVRSVKTPILFEPLFGFDQKRHEHFSSLKAITPSSLLFSTFIFFSHKIFQYNSFEILIGFRKYLRLVEGAELVLPAIILPSARSPLGSVSHTTVFLQLLSNFMNSCNICQINVKILTRSQILNYSLGKNVHQQEANLQSNCHLLKLSFLKKRFPFLNNFNHLQVTWFFIAPSNFKTQNPSFELGKFFKKNIVELVKNQEASLELDIERTWKDHIHHAYGLGVTEIASLIISLNRFFCPTLAWEKVLINNNSVKLFLTDIFSWFSYSSK